VTGSLEGFVKSEFIQQYWQKNPCLIRQAFPGLKSPITPEELAGLACEDGVHSRLIIEKDADTPWKLLYGPFQEEVFLKLPETHYSLLVSECEKWVPALSKLLDQFRFIPHWRIDDLMVSYAPPGGSVGPHSDEYDVFLLQAQGSRKWQYSDCRVENQPLIPDLDLAIMQVFNADHEAVLHPGDMLYLPPGIAHHGVAIDDCLTFSIGFRAPTAIEVLESFMLEASRQNAASIRYTDPALETDRHFAEITQNEVEQFRALALSLIEKTDSLWVDSVGKLLSDSMVAGNDGDPDKPPALPERLFDHDWIVNPESRMLYHRNDSVVTFYCDGRGYEMPNSESSIEVIKNLCEFRFISAAKIESCRANLPVIEMLQDLVKTGTLMLEEE
jgi:50S ribosomal protein L16 3-hydroxylase